MSWNFRSACRGKLMSEGCQILNLSKSGWNDPKSDCGWVSVISKELETESELPITGDTTAVTSVQPC